MFYLGILGLGRSFGCGGCVMERGEFGETDDVVAGGEFSMFPLPCVACKHFCFLRFF